MPYSNEHFSFDFGTGRAQWDALLAHIHDATQTIDIEQFIFVPSRIGTIFFSALITKAKKGVRVRILADMLGSKELYYSLPWRRRLKRAGVMLKFFNPVKWYRFDKIFEYNIRTHRKVLCIDSKRVVVGSGGIMDDGSDWQETWATSTHPAFIKDVMTVFEQEWGYKQPVPAYVGMPPTDSGSFSLLHGINTRSEADLYKVLLERVQNAKKHIHLVTPYFIIPKTLLEELKEAVSRRVRVEIILAKKSDLEILDAARIDSVYAALHAGISMYVYDGPLLHAKYGIVDNVWAYVGSSNLDYRSLEINRELNVGIEDISSIERCVSEFETVQKSSLILTTKTYPPLITWKMRLMKPFLRPIIQYF